MYARLIKSHFLGNTDRYVKSRELYSVNSYIKALCSKKSETNHKCSFQEVMATDKVRLVLRTDYWRERKRERERQREREAIGKDEARETDEER